MALDATPPLSTDAAVVVGSLATPRLFDRVYELHHDAVFRYAASRVGAQEAEDLVGEVFATAFGTRGRFDPARAESALPWLLGIATRLIHRRRDVERRWIRNLAATQELPHGDDTAIEDVPRRADASRAGDRLAAAVMSLPLPQRDPLLLHVLGGLTYEEAAEALDLPVGTVRSRIHRARVKLAAALDQGQEQ